MLPPRRNAVEKFNGNTKKMNKIFLELWIFQNKIKPKGFENDNVMINLWVFFQYFIIIVCENHCF